MLRQFRNYIQGLTVRQPQKSDVYIFNCGEIVGGRHKSQIRETEQISVDVAHGLARMFICRDKHDLGVRMKQQYPQKFAPAVARTAKNRDANAFHTAATTP